MGTMANTLILAYIGSSFTTVLLYASYQASLEQLLNRELIIVELLQALSGSIGIYAPSQFPHSLHPVYEPLKKSNKKRLNASFIARTKTTPYYLKIYSTFLHNLTV